MPVKHDLMVHDAAAAVGAVPIACIGRECQCECQICCDGKHCRRVDCYVEEFHPYRESDFVAA